MRLRRTSLAASLLILTLSASAMAQAPAGGSPAESAYPAMSQADYPSALFDDGGNFDWQWRFSADAVYMTRNNRLAGIPIISGPDTFRFRDLDFDYRPGTRFAIALMQGDFELEAGMTTIDDWTETLRGTLPNAVVFDGEATFLAADAAAKATVGDANFLEPTTFFAPINAAANFTSGATNETTELQFLEPDAEFETRYDTRLQEFDINMKRRLPIGRRVRVGVGFRNIRLNESGFARLSGSFATVDSNVGVPDATDNLSNLALTNAVTGGGLTPNPGASGFTAGDVLQFTSSTRTTNELNGVQATLDASLFESQDFQIGGYAKAGVFQNSAHGSVTESYQTVVADPLIPVIYSRDLDDAKDRFAFAGNLGVTGTVSLRDNLRLVGAYELMYVSGVALAPDQVGGVRKSATNVTSLRLQSDGDVLFHGGRIGIEILFP